MASVHLDLMWCPAGPALEAGDHHACKRIAQGSGFLYRLDGDDFLVTARHNLTGRHWQTNGCLGSPPVEPTHLRVSFLAMTPSAGWPIQLSDAQPGVGSMEVRVKSHLIPLLGEDWKPLWAQHPHWGPQMDVAALALKSPGKDVLVMPWQRDKPPQPADATWHDLAAGDDVFIVGYPYGLTHGPVMALWMRGTVATEPFMAYRVDDDDLPLMVVDARTRAGQSGSPVIRSRQAGTFVKLHNGMPATTAGRQSQIVGVYSGRTSDDSDLGYVWRIEEAERICRDGVPGTIKLS